MSLYVLDTDILTLYQQGHRSVVRHVHEHPFPELATTIISVEEELPGWLGRGLPAAERNGARPLICPSPPGKRLR